MFLASVGAGKGACRKFLVVREIFPRARPSANMNINFENYL